MFNVLASLILCCDSICLKAISAVFIWFGVRPRALRTARDSSMAVSGTVRFGVCFYFLRAFLCFGSLGFRAKINSVSATGMFYQPFLCFFFVFCFVVGFSYDFF